MKDILKKFKSGKLSIEETERLLRSDFVLINDIAKFDVHRKHRTGVPEMVIAEDKTVEDTVEIVRQLVKKKIRVVVTRIPEAHLGAIRKIKGAVIEYHEKPGLCVAYKKGTPEPDKVGGKVGIITAGTSDIPVAEEARIITEECGASAFTAYDVGVAGIHRLFPSLEKMLKDDMDVYIVAAGREGALPTLIAGIVDSPVIGLPISSGYGMAGSGQSALYAMLQSCSPLAVVNIDSGFAAGAVAAQIANRMAVARERK